MPVEKGTVSRKYILKAFKWKENNPSDTQRAKEADGRTTKIALVVNSVHRDEGRIVGEKKESLFKLNIEKWKSMMTMLQDASKHQLLVAADVLKINGCLQTYDIGRSPPWETLQAHFIKQLETDGWFAGSAIPITSEHHKIVRELRLQNRLSAAPQWRVPLMSFKNPVNEQKPTEDRMMITIQHCHDKANEAFKQKFHQATSAVARVYHMAQALQMCAVFQRICEGQCDEIDAVYLISPALFNLIDYYGKSECFLYRDLPLNFKSKPNIEVSATQMSSMPIDDGTSENRALRMLQLENARFMNIAGTRLPPCASRLSKTDLLQAGRPKPELIQLQSSSSSCTSPALHALQQHVMSIAPAISSKPFDPNVDSFGDFQHDIDDGPPPPPPPPPQQRLTHHNSITYDQQLIAHNIDLQTARMQQQQQQQQQVVTPQQMPRPTQMPDAPSKGKGSRGAKGTKRKEQHVSEGAAAGTSAPPPQKRSRISKQQQAAIEAASRAEAALAARNDLPDGGDDNDNDVDDDDRHVVLHHDVIPPRRLFSSTESITTTTTVDEGVVRGNNSGGDNSVNGGGGELPYNTNDPMMNMIEDSITQVHAEERNKRCTALTKTVNL
eukprot:Seg3562.5 transcript_id=Seg3562.5/GoldUCD/mRNA.D3Y31 product="hypothetical protein" protein_id=Seg3562.5/GoldUCD/D3Y31